MDAKTLSELTLDDALPYFQNQDAAAPEAENVVDTPPAAATAEVKPEDIATEAAMRAAQQLQAANQRIAALEAAQKQMSQQAEAKVEEEILEPPVLDMTNYAYMSDEERAEAQKAYSKQMLDYVSKGVDKGLKPVVEYVTKQKTSAEERAVFEDLKTKTDIDKYMPAIEEFLGTDSSIAKNIANLPPREKLVAAYMLVKGNESLTSKKTPEQIAEEAFANPDTMRAIKLKEQAALKQNQNVPAQAASSGMANIPITTNKKPETWDDANELALKYFG